ncbi:MAG: aspartate-semialdehyde dehydrogenase, partial [Sideroxydans sp.]
MKVGLIGWRGMVGSVLMQRMREEKDFDLIEAVFFTTSNVGGEAPSESRGESLKDAYDLKMLMAMDAIISCQGGDYTTEIFPGLRAAGWQGYWIDAASTLRMEKDAVIILDPVNLDLIRKSLANGGRNFIGGNC